MGLGTKAIRLSKAAREFNVGISTIVEFLHKKGFDVDANPNTKLSAEAYDLLANEYSDEISVKKESEKLSMRHFMDTREETALVEDDQSSSEPIEQEEEVLIKDSSGATGVVGTTPKAETASKSPDTLTGEIPTEEAEKKPEEKEAKEKVSEPSSEKEDRDLKVVGKIDLEKVS